MHKPAPLRMIPIPRYPIRSCCWYGPAFTLVYSAILIPGSYESSSTEKEELSFDAISFDSFSLYLVLKRAPPLGPKSIYFPTFSLQKMVYELWPKLPLRIGLLRPTRLLGDICLDWTK